MTLVGAVGADATVGILLALAAASSGEEKPVEKSVVSFIMTRHGWDIEMDR
jgi:hypothetical protein